MLGKVRNGIIVIYVSIGLLYILANINGSSTYMRPKRQLWSMDHHPAIVLYRQHPNSLRKFYWYNSRTPILVGKMRLKNYMRSMQMLPRYAMLAPVQYHDTFANSKRNVFRDLNNIHGFKSTSTTTATNMDYVATHPNPPMVFSTGPINRPVEYITPLNVNPFVPLTAKTPSVERLIGLNNQWNHSRYSSESWNKKCPERIMNTAAGSSEDCFKSSPPDFAKDQYSAHSMPVSELPATTTNLPFFNYVAHTFFTLDDVILPRSKSGKSSVRDTKEFRPKPAVVTTDMPKELVTERYQRTTHVIPTTITTTEAAWLPVKPTFMSSEYISSAIKTEAKVFEPPTIWTTAQPIRNNYSTPNVSGESYKHRLKSLKATKNFSSSIETKLKLLKLHLKNLVTTKETPKFFQNVTASALIESNTALNDSTTTPTPATSRRNANRKLRKVRIMSSTKKTPAQILRNSTNTNKAKMEHKKPKRIFERRKLFNSTVAPEILKNASTDDIDLVNKFKRRTSVNGRKQQNVAESPSVRNSTKIISHTIAKSRADGIQEEKSVSTLVTESAIMTISSGNIKLRQPKIKVKSKQHSTRKNINLENDNFIPSLPIEVYFKKVNQQ
ncbi:uncharacterized protein LOC110191691 [Drosophila serrata]|uniref:uncharacterized protein LOC110191691 n=1 Tax=Drosophila serrata TaxID=7274 RepID=UPI000A1CF7E7|nr:uncharacterized protein LOC110191691 [Drosophila serrata]